MANEENKKNGMDEGMQVVAFKLRDEEYGVSILNVQEIRNLTDITRVPFAADFIKGVINLRGSVLPVIDLKQRLGLAETPYTENTRIVTVNIDDLLKDIKSSVAPPSAMKKKDKAGSTGKNSVVIKL